jgi:hypothetical protein
MDRGTRRNGSFIKALLAAYLLSAALLPLLHHDLVCHVKSSTHCTSCIATAAGEPAPHGAGLDSAMIDVGHVSSSSAAWFQVAPLLLSPGRSPPVFQYS